MSAEKKTQWRTPLALAAVLALTLGFVVLNNYSSTSESAARMENGVIAVPL